MTSYIQTNLCMWDLRLVAVILEINKLLSVKVGHIRL